MTALTTLLLVSSAQAAVFKATVSGKQNLEWTVGGTSGNCEIRTGTGKGSTDFSFSSPKAAFLTITSSKKSAKVVGSIPATAKGTVTGSFSEQTTTPCPGYAPSDPFTEDASQCGGDKFGVRLDFKTNGAFVYVTAPSTYLAGGRRITGQCPTPIGSAYLSTNVLTTCGDGAKQYERSWGVANAWGEGLFATKLTISKNLAKLKKGKSKTITGKASVDCTVGSPFSAGVTFKGSLKYAVKFTRFG
jgi:hypothetical protein